MRSEERKEGKSGLVLKERDRESGGECHESYVRKGFPCKLVSSPESHSWCLALQSLASDWSAEAYARP